MKSRKALFAMALVPLLSMSACKNEPGEEPRASLGPQQTGEEGVEEARGRLGDILGTALTEGDFSDLTDNFTKVDRDRLSREPEVEIQDLDQKVASFNSAWKEKYGTDFDADDEIASLYNYAFKQSPNGREMNVAIAASHNLPPVTLKFLNEGAIGTDWRLDVPDNLSKQTLKSNLIQQYGKIEAAKNTWPADREEARRFVAHSLFQAFTQS